MKYIHTYIDRYLYIFIFISYLFTYMGTHAHGKPCKAHTIYQPVSIAVAGCGTLSELARADQTVVSQQTEQDVL